MTDCCSDRAILVTRIGRIGQLRLPEVVAARKRVAAAALKNGKFAMTAGLIADFSELVAEGYPGL